MLVQARGMLIAVRLVPTPSSTNLLSPSLSVTSHLILSFSLLSPLILNTGLVCRTLVVQSSYTRTCVHEQSVAKVHTKATSFLCVSAVNARTSHRVYIDLDGAWTSPDTRTRAASRAPSDNARDPCATPLFFLLLFHPKSPRRALALDISCYILAISILFTILFFLPYLSSFISYFSLFFCHGQRFSLASSFSSFSQFTCPFHILCIFLIH